jgi:hypothetical protein
MVTPPSARWYCWSPAPWSQTAGSGGGRKRTGLSRARSRSCCRFRSNILSTPPRRGRLVPASSKSFRPTTYTGEDTSTPYCFKTRSFVLFMKLFPTRAFLTPHSQAPRPPLLRPSSRRGRCCSNGTTIGRPDVSGYRPSICFGGPRDGKWCCHAAVIRARDTPSATLRAVAPSVAGAYRDAREFREARRR